MKRKLSFFVLLGLLVLCLGLLCGCGASNKTAEPAVTPEPEPAGPVPMSTVELAEYVQDRTVTVNVETFNGCSSTGSGFFIDDEGTIVTNFHVIDKAESISVEIGTGATYNVSKIVDFSNLYDLAILKIDVGGQPYLELVDSDARTGEQVFAVGSALGTLKGSFTGGYVSSVKRTYGRIDCIQMDAAISPGNSGGPLVNLYGQVVGVNVASYNSGENLNLAIKASTLELLARDKNWTVKDFKEWYEQEANRSWSPWYIDEDGEQHWQYSLVNTYQQVTGSPCLRSCLETASGKIKTTDGYDYENDYFVYKYSAKEYDDYVNYLKSVGFDYDSSENYSDGTSYYYYNEKDGILIDIFVSKDSTELRIYPEC